MRKGSGQYTDHFPDSRHLGLMALGLVELRLRAVFLAYGYVRLCRSLVGLQ